MCYKLYTVLRELFTVKNLSAVSCLMEQENVKMLRFILFCMINVTLPPLPSLIYHFYSFSAFIKHFRQSDCFNCHVQLCFPDFKYAEWMILKKNLPLIISLGLTHGFLGNSGFSCLVLKVTPPVEFFFFANVHAWKSSNFTNTKVNVIHWGWDMLVLENKSRSCLD